MKAWAVFGGTPIKEGPPLPSSSEPAPWRQGGEDPECACFSSPGGLRHHRGLSALPFPRLLLLDAGGSRDALPDGQEPEGGELLRLTQHQDAVPLCLCLWVPRAGGAHLRQHTATGLRDA